MTKVGNTTGRGRCDNVLITVSVRPAVLQLCGPQPVAAGYTTGEKHIVSTVTSRCMKSSDNVAARRVSD